MHYQNKYNFNCPTLLEQHQYKNSNILGSYNNFYHQEENDERGMKTPKFLSSGEQDSCLKNNLYQLNPLLKKGK